MILFFCVIPGITKEKLLPIKIVSIIETGMFNGSKGLIIDGKMPGKGMPSNSEGTLWWNDKSAHLVFDLGKIYKIQSINIEVDSNDSYNVDYSVDGKEYKNLIKILMTYGDASIGLDIFSTSKTEKSYVKELELKPVEARYLKLYAVEGDDMYSVAEFQVFGTPANSASPHK